jgi:hypothetical protein
VGVQHHALKSSCWKVPGCEMGINTQQHLAIFSAENNLVIHASNKTQTILYYANHHSLSLTPRVKMCSISDATEASSHAEGDIKLVAVWIIALFLVLCCSRYPHMPSAPGS